MANRIVRVILRGDIGDLVGKMTAAGKAVSDTADKMTGASKEAKSFRDGLDEVASTAGKVGLTAAAGLGAAVVASMNFDQAMSGVAAATHESEQNMQKLRDAAIQAGADTAFSAGEAASAVEALAKAGVSTADILGGGLSGSMSLAAAGSIDVSEAAEIAASALTQFKLSGKDVPHVADLLAAGAGKAQGEVSDLGQALNQAALVASQTGLSIEETTGALAAFASAGLIGSDAGTAFKTMLQSLVPNSDAAAGMMDALGIHAYDAGGKFVGMAKFAGILQDGLKDLSVEEQNTALKTIFGSDAVRAASVLYDQGADGIQKWIDATNDSGYAADTASIKLDNLAGDFEQLKGSLETALIGTGDSAQGPLRKLVQGATNAVNAFSALPPAAHGVTAALLGITAVTGGALFLGSAVIGRIATMRLALVDLKLISDTTTLSLAGLARGAGAVGVALAAGFAVHQLADGAAAPIGKVTDALYGLANGAGDTKAALDDAFSGTNTSWAIPAKMDIDGLKDSFEALNASNFSKFGQFAHSGFGIFDTKADLATKAVGKLDTALTDMVTRGDTVDAGIAFQYIAEQAEAAGISTDKLAELLPSYSAAISEATTVNLSLGDAMAGTLDMMSGRAPGIDAVTGKVLTAADAQKQAAEKMVTSQKAADDAMKKAEAAADAAGNAFVGYGKDLDNAKVSLKDWIKEQDAQNKAMDKALDNARALRRKGVSAEDVKDLLDQGPAGALRLQQLATGGDAEIAEFKRVKKAERRELEEFNRFYLRLMGMLPPITPKVNTDPAITSIKQIKRMLASVPKAVRTDYYVNQVNAINGHQGGGAGGGRDGDPDTPYWSGGYTGAGAKFEAAGIVHRGEYVFSSEATRGNEAYLDGLHRSMRGYAGGGYVTQPTMSMTSHAIDYDRLSRAMLAARPLRGNTTVMPHNYNEFRREMAEDERLASLDGVRR